MDEGEEADAEETSIEEEVGVGQENFEEQTGPINDDNAVGPRAQESDQGSSSD